MEIKGIFFDFDWTLFDHKVRDFVSSAIKAIHYVQQKGVKVFINSARTYYSLEGLKTFDKFNFDGFVTSNGGVALLKDKTLYSYTLSDELENKLLEIAEKNNLSFVAKTLDKEYISIKDKAIVDKFYSIFFEPFPLNFEKRNKNEKIVSFQFIMNPEQEYLLKDLDNCYINHYYEDAYEITSKEFHKAEGIEKIIEELHFKKENLAAFGDDLNDISMFNLVKYGICMGNGNPQAKLHAKYVTSNIEDNGILNGLKYLGLIGDDFI